MSGLRNSPQPIRDALHNVAGVSVFRKEGGDAELSILLQWDNLSLLQGLQLFR